METNKTDYSYSSFFIGMITGVVVGSLLLSQVMNNITLYISVGVCGILGAFIGSATGKKMGEKLDIEIALGHNEVVNDILPVPGKKCQWIAISKWNNKIGNDYLLLTFLNASGLLVSTLNDKPIKNHKANSGSKKMVVKAHKKTRSEVLKQQIALY